MSLTSVVRLQAVLSAYLPAAYLAPALAHLSFDTSMLRARSVSWSFPRSKIRHFSTTPSHQKRAVHREKNKSRGVSAIRRTGPRVPLPIAKYELPRPVLDPPARKEFKTNPKHGLWGFFNADKTAMLSPEEELAHGRSWTYAELNYKSFEDLHALYWVCLKERNRIATAQKERHRVFAGYGDYEALSRNNAVVATMRRIRRLLRDRYHSWQEAMAIVDRISMKDLPPDKGEEYEESDMDLEGEDKLNDPELKEPLG